MPGKEDTLQFLKYLAENYPNLTLGDLVGMNNLPPIPEKPEVEKDKK